eukprot:scaffold2375_cov107-Isochrysis_galbana.AAC.4
MVNSRSLPGPEKKSSSCLFLSAKIFFITGHGQGEVVECVDGRKSVPPKRSQTGEHGHVAEKLVLPPPGGPARRSHHRVSPTCPSESPAPMDVTTAMRLTPFVFIA